MPRRKRAAKVAPEDKPEQRNPDRLNARRLMREAMEDILAPSFPAGRARALNRRLGDLIEKGLKEAEDAKTPGLRQRLVSGLTIQLKRLAESQLIASKDPTRRISFAIGKRLELERSVSPTDIFDPPTGKRIASDALLLSIELAKFDGDAATLANASEKIISTLPEQRDFKHDLSGDLSSLLTKAKPPSSSKGSG